MKTLLLGVAALLGLAGIAGAHHVAVNSRLAAHHAVSDVTLAGSAAETSAEVAKAEEAEAAGREIERGPFDGALVPLGDSAVLEFNFDSSTGVFLMHAWDSELENVIFLGQPMLVLKIATDGSQARGVLLKPVENEATGEGYGHTTTFRGGTKTLIGLESFDVILENVATGGMVFYSVPFSYPAGNGLGPGPPGTPIHPDTGD